MSLNYYQKLYFTVSTTRISIRCSWWCKKIKQADFDDRIDVIPVADPNIFSMSQRITLAQTQLQLATSNPQIHNLYQVYRNMYEAIGVKNVDAVLPPPAPNCTNGPKHGTH